MTRSGPYSRALQRGAISDSIDGRSADGRFLRSFEAQLVDHVGGQPSITQRILIGRSARIALRLEAFDRKAMAGGLTDLDERTAGALENRLRLLLRELGLKRTPSKAEAPSLASIIAEHVANKVAAA